MYLRGIFAAFAALLISATLVGNAEAYPTTARSATATVTGLYRPLDLNLSLVDGFEALSYSEDVSNPGQYYFSYTALYSGFYSSSPGSPYNFSGLAGNWELSFNYYGGSDVSDDGSNIISWLAPGNLADSVGTLTFLGGDGYAGVPASDTPQAGDFFRFYAMTAGASLLQVTCADGVTACETFTLELLQDLKILGPYVPCVGDCVPALAADRVNLACNPYADNPAPCGSVPMDSFRASSVPEPGSLALVGLALAGLTLVRRMQQRRHQPWIL